MNSYKKIFLIFTVFFTGIITFSDLYSQSVVWRQVIGDQYNEEGYDVIELKDKGFIMVGYKQIVRPGTTTLTFQSLLVKLDKYGNILWQKLIGDSTLYGNDCYAVTEDLNGNLYIPYNAGYAHLLKMNSQGIILWDKNFSSNNIGYFAGISFTDNYKRLVLNGLNIVNGNFTSSFTKLDSSGNMIWTKSYYDSLPAFRIYSTYSNCYLISTDNYFICGEKGVNGFIIKTDTSGNRIWTAIFPETRGIYSIAENSENTFIATGSSREYNTYCFKFSINADTIWTKNYRTSNNIYLGVSKIVNIVDGNFALGTSCGGNRTIMGIIDSNGNLLNTYENIYPINVDVCQHNMNTTSDSGFVFTGYLGFPPNFANLNTLTEDVLIYKTDKNGNTVFINNSEIKISEKIDICIYPNPFNLSFKLTFSLLNASKVELTLFDVSGRKVREIENNNLNIGEHQYLINTPELSSGIYFIKANIDNEVFSKKVLLIK